MKIFLYIPVLFAVFLSCGVPEDDNNTTDKISESTPELSADSLSMTENTDTIKKLLQENADTLLRQLQSGEQKFDLYANFTEPFFTLYFLDQRVLFNGMDEGARLFPADKKFNNRLSEQTIHFGDDDQHWKVLIRKESGSDGMSEIDYPYSVLFDDTFYGGGAEEFLRPE